MQLAHAAPRRASRRPAAIAATVMASVLVLSTVLVSQVRAAILPTTPARAADVSDATNGSGTICTGQGAYKVVIVVGPVGSSTARFTDWANKIGTAATNAGMNVCKVYTPYADAATVKTAAKGADLFVALMHGNGYPHQTSTGRGAGAEPNDGNDATAHGLGLNASYGSSSLKYFGADWVISNLRLAPNAIVLLSHMCNTAGNSEDADPIPTYELAIDHVDNFARGFLASTSFPSGSPSVVMALQSQSFDLTTKTLFTTLMTSTSTMDQAFMKSYGANTGTWAGSYLPNYGGVGTTDFYVTRRSDGAGLRSSGQVHLDPDLAYPGKLPPPNWDRYKPDVAWLNTFAGKAKNIQNPNGSGQVRFGYVRAITGNLTFKASTWKSGASTGTTPTPTPTPTPDPTPTPSPSASAALTTLRAAQAVGTIPAGDESLPVFTPNGDGTSDSLTLHYKSTAAAKLRVTVTASSDTVVRTFSVAGKKGSSSLVWNGKTNSGAIAPDGTYAVKVQIVGGNSKTTSVKVLTAIKVPVTSRVLMHASDGDSLAKSAKQSVAVRANAHLRWRILDAYGDVVRTGIDNERVGRGTTTWTWDGKDDAGAYVPDGVYTSIVTATTSKGAYSHQVTIRVMPYSVVGDFVQRPGQWNTFAVYAAETQKVAPTITVKQPGMAAYKLTLKKVTTNRWSAIWKARPGKTGAATFTISGTDELGGKQSSGWKGTIQ